MRHDHYNEKQAIGGDIVNIVSKNAQLHMSRLMAAELVPYKIRVNVVNPDAVIEDSFIWQSGWAEGRAKAYGITVASAFSRQATGKIIV